MAKKFEVLNQLGGGFPTTLLTKLLVDAGAASSIKAGMIVTVDGGTAGYVLEGVDGLDTDGAPVVGIAASDSTETATVDGYVDVITAPVLVVKGKATTPANLAQALILTNKYTLDVSSEDHTIDENATTKGLFSILSYDNTTDGNCIATIACRKFVSDSAI